MQPAWLFLLWLDPRSSRPSSQKGGNTTENLASLLSEAHRAVTEWQHTMMYRHDENFHLEIEWRKILMNSKLRELRDHLWDKPLYD